MNKKLKLLLNKSDIILIGIVVVLSLALYATFNYFYDSKDASTVNIYYENKIVATLDLNQDQTFTLEKSKYPSLLADLTVEVKEGKVQIAKETSPNNICSKQGWTDSTLKPLVCLPNMVLVTVTGDTIDVQGIDFEVE